MDTNTDNKKVDPEVESLKKQVRELQDIVNVYTLAPRIIDVMIRARGEKTPYVSGGNTVACDLVLQIEWQGRRYNLPAFEL